MVNSIIVPEKGGATDHLLNEALAQLPKDEQIRIITEGLTNSSTQADVERFLWALERSMFAGHLDFRCHLRNVYQKHVLQVIRGRGRPKTEVQFAILRRILAGWTWQDHHKAPNTLLEDAEECFLFLVWVYRRALGREDPKKFNNITWDSELTKEIDGIFAEHLRHSGNWNPNRLDSWIARDEVPEQLALVLTKARARLLDGSQAKVEAMTRSSTQDKLA